LIYLPKSKYTQKGEIIMNIKNVTVFGAGQMGRQMAVNFAIHGYRVIITDKIPTALDSAKVWIDKYLDERVKKGKLSDKQVSEIRQRLIIQSDAYIAAKDADLIVEAIIEQEEDKCELFAYLDKICPVQTILTSNSSFIPSSIMAEHVKRKDKTANLHFFNPALVMKLVEVVKNPWTSEQTIRTLMDFAVSCDKTPIFIKKEIDGFVANRIIAKISSEALYLVENDYVAPEDVDTAVENGLNHPMGPFRLMDLVGIDISYLSRARKYKKTKDPQDKPPAFLEEKYKTGEFGRKTGKGWYTY